MINNYWLDLANNICMNGFLNAEGFTLSISTFID